MTTLFVNDEDIGTLLVDTQAIQHNNAIDMVVEFANVPCMEAGICRGDINYLQAIEDLGGNSLCFRPLR